MTQNYALPGNRERIAEYDENPSPAPVRIAERRHDQNSRMAPRRPVQSRDPPILVIRSFELRHFVAARPSLRSSEAAAYAIPRRWSGKRISGEKRRQEKGRAASRAGVVRGLEQEDRPPENAAPNPSESPRFTSIAFITLTRNDPA